MEDNIRLCNHCYNTTSHQLIVDGDVKRITREANITNGKGEIRQSFTYFFVKCETCGEYSLLGCFNDQLENPKLADIPVISPKPSFLDSSVPPKIRRVYDEAASIKKEFQMPMQHKSDGHLNTYAMTKKPRATAFIISLILW